MCIVLVPPFLNARYGADLINQDKVPSKVHTSVGRYLSSDYNQYRYELVSGRTVRITSIATYLRSAPTIGSSLIIPIDLPEKIPPKRRDYENSLLVCLLST